MGRGREVDIELSLGRLGTLLLLAVVALVALSPGSPARAGTPEARAVVAEFAATAPERRFYLTVGTHDGRDADTACAVGYHMAALWEILDVSNARYDTSLGYQMPAGDCGEGPPSGVYGWVRTGGAPSVGAVPGSGNCAVWSQSYTGQWGSAAALPTAWTGGGPGWVVGTRDCSIPRRVWCVQNAGLLYLPLILGDS